MATQSVFCSYVTRLMFLWPLEELNFNGLMIPRAQQLYSRDTIVQSKRWRKASSINCYPTVRAYQESNFIGIKYRQKPILHTPRTQLLIEIMPPIKPIPKLWSLLTRPCDIDRGFTVQDNPSCAFDPSLKNCAQC
jgi:hypothetical protein